MLRWRWIFSKFRKESTSARVSFLIKVQASACNFIKRRLGHKCFPVSFANIYKNTFLTENVRWLLLKISNKDIRVISNDIIMSSVMLILKVSWKSWHKFVAMKFWFQNGRLKTKNIHFKVTCPLPNPAKICFCLRFCRDL